MYLVAYLLDPLPQHWRRLERHARECWHCMQVYSILTGDCHVETS
ncbi:MAG: hypothetical protein ANABAC_1306 [Anaerolineae bacterium]|nr:MAG: hypothetical protein ANABAC_1306 [Anaerolineae bacterium]